MVDMVHTVLVVVAFLAGVATVGFLAVLDRAAAQPYGFDRTQRLHTAVWGALYAAAIGFLVLLLLINDWA